jgi:hypothetical protein
VWWLRISLGCDRDQELLLPPSLREWLAEDHLAWFVIDAIDLSAFYSDYREDGWGRAAHEPAMMVALLLYAYAIGERSSRAIERRCREDVAFRVICANRVPGLRRDCRNLRRPQGRTEGPTGPQFVAAQPGQAITRAWSWSSCWSWSASDGPGWRPSADAPSCRAGWWRPRRGR